MTPTAPRLRHEVLARLASSLLNGPVQVDDPSVLRTERLVIRPMLTTDADHYTALVERSRDHLARHFPLHREGETSRQVFDRHLAFARAAQATGRAWRRLICLDGAIIGAINLNDISQGQHPHAELNAWIGPGYAQRGLGSEAFRAVLQHAFSAAPSGLGLARAWGYVADDNHASLHAIHRLGFTREAGAPPVQLNLAGRWVTHRIYSRSAPTVAIRSLVAARARSRVA